MMPTKIEWCDETWNPITGCTKISPACDHCYAERMAKRLAGRCGYPADEPFRVTFHPERLTEPLKWKKPRRIFVVSMGDLFHEAVEERSIIRIFSIMASAPDHTFMILTKRPKRMKRFLLTGDRFGDILADADDLYDDYHLKFQPPHPGEWPLPNVWLGATVEDQERADERIPVLLQCPAAVRFVSCEPLLGPLNIDKGLPHVPPCDDCFSGRAALDWVIAGGETGPGARPAHPDWFRAIRDQCQAAGVLFFFKGWGSWEPMLENSGPLIVTGNGKKYRSIGIDGKTGNKNNPPYAAMGRFVKNATSRLLDGREHNEFPRGESR